MFKCEVRKCICFAWKGELEKSITDLRNILETIEEKEWKDEVNNTIKIIELRLESNERKVIFLFKIIEIILSKKIKRK